MQSLDAASRLFVRAGIEFRAVKGPSLGALAYGDAGLRPCDDIDILVRRRDLERAHEVLRSSGYVAQGPDGLRFSRAARAAGLWPQWLSANGIPIDLVTGLSSPYMAVRCPDDILFAAPQSVMMDDVKCETLPLPLLVLFLAVHAGKHRWSRLIWLADIAALAWRHHERLDADRLVALARTTGTLRMLCLAELLSEDLFGEGLHADIAALAHRDATAARLAESLSARLRAGERNWPADDAGRARFHVRVRERLRDRAAYIAGRAFRPGANDIRAFHLPDSLYPLYGVLRPLRLCSSMFRNVR